MPSIDVVDSIEINASPAEVFAVISDYNNITRWLPVYRCELLDAATLAPGVKVRHRYGKRIVINEFIRRIDKIVAGERLEESYIAGDLEGTGVWCFDSVSDGGGSDGKAAITNVSYHCKVRSKSWLNHIVFFLMGASGHSAVYRELLGALKVRCE